MTIQFMMQLLPTIIKFLIIYYLHVKLLKVKVYLKQGRKIS